MPANMRSTPGMTPRQLLANMAAGKVLQRDFTIVDGWTFAELRAGAGPGSTRLQHDSARRWTTPRSCSGSALPAKLPKGASCRRPTPT